MMQKKLVGTEPVDQKETIKEVQNAEEIREIIRTIESYLERTRESIDRIEKFIEELREEKRVMDANEKGQERPEEKKNLDPGQHSPAI